MTNLLTPTEQIAEARKGLLHRIRCAETDLCAVDIENVKVLRFALRILERVDEEFIAKVIDADKNWSEPEGDEVMLAQSIITAMVKEKD